jgi:hypothetical protein
MGEVGFLRRVGPYFAPVQFAHHNQNSSAGTVTEYFGGRWGIRILDLPIKCSPSLGIRAEIHTLYSRILNPTGLAIRHGVSTIITSVKRGSTPCNISVTLPMASDVTRLRTH